MKFRSTPSFIRCFKKLGQSKKEIVEEAIRRLLNLYNMDLNPKGLGLKQLRRDLWEIRASLQERILFSIEGDTIHFILVGNHDEVKKFLKNI